MNALLSLCLLAPLPATDAGWPQFLGPTRDGHAQVKGLKNAWPATGPKKVWEKEVGEGYSGPVIVGDRLLLFHRVGDQEELACLDANTGKSRWSFRYPTEYRDSYGKGDGPRSTPTVSAGRVYTLGAEGMLSCVDLARGTKVWQRPLGKDYALRTNFFGVGTSPLVEGDLVVVNVGARGAGIVAFDRNTGKEVWRATNHEASYSSGVIATVQGKRQLFFFTREGLVVLEPKTGKVLYQKHWRARLYASVNAATPLIHDDQVFITASYRTGAVLLDFTRKTPEEIWKGDEILSAHYNTPVLVGEFLYGVDGRQEEGARLRCVEWKTGKVRWTKEGFGCASIIAADGKLIILSEGGDLFLVQASPKGYQELARASVLTPPCRAPLALANGQLYARDNHKLVCWKLE
jgi:outer membrane protein assembly factor BamB